MINCKNRVLVCQNKADVEINEESWFIYSVLCLRLSFNIKLQKINPLLSRISLNLNQKPVASDADEIVA